MTTADHPEWGALMAAIVANPDDDTVRLVAADFLEENGDPDRAAFIRIQVQLARLEADGEGKSLEADHLRAKERTLFGPLSTYLMLWAAEACPELVKMPSHGGGRGPLEGVTVEGAYRLSWSRGFVFSVQCSAREWQQHGLAIRRRQPIQAVSLNDSGDVNVPEWLGMLPTLRGLAVVYLLGGFDFARLEWLQSQLPGTHVVRMARR